MGYLVEPRDRIFVKGYGFSLLLKIRVKILTKDISKTEMLNTVQVF